MASDNVTFTAPYAAVTSTNRGGQLVIVNIVGLLVSLFSVALRIKISRRETQDELFAFYKDDLLCFVAAVCQFKSPASNVHCHTNLAFQAILHY
jgi:hypothetical protein